LELNAGAGYLRFDPAKLRGGDPPGRSTAAVAVRDEPGRTTIEVSALTPDGSSGSDESDRRGPPDGDLPDLI
jgi:hypothetical protein